MKAVVKQLVIVYFSCILAACASSDEAPSDESAEAVSRSSDCISQGSIRDYAVLDESNLIVSDGPKRDYHVVLVRRAFGLKSSWRIGFQSATGRICAGFSDVVVDDGLGPERIRIRSIRRLTAEDKDELLVAFGKKEPDHEQARQPEEIEGAEVEELD